MKALILVGGFGTRLRPLTENRPKPLVEFCNQPMMTYQMKELIKAGVNHIILAVSYKADQMNKFVEEQEKLFNIKITLSHEKIPLGTAGPLALAREQLLSKQENHICNGVTNNNNNTNNHYDNEDDVPFFVLNSDIICDYPFEQMLDFYNRNKGQGTIVVTKVQDPSKYGVVVFDQQSGLVERFVEKPSTFVSDKINAGLYILNKSILKRIKLEPTSIEREIFPAMAADKQLYAIPLNGYWMDVGQPPDYIKGLGLYLNWVKTSQLKTRLAESNSKKMIKVEGNVLIDPTAKIGENCVIGPDVCIGPDVQIGSGCHISYSTILEGAILSCKVNVSNSIVGWKCKLGNQVSLKNTCVLGEQVTVKDDVRLNGARVWPAKIISESVEQPTDII